MSTSRFVQVQAIILQAHLVYLSSYLWRLMTTMKKKGFDVEALRSAEQRAGARLSQSLRGRYTVPQ